MIAVGISELHPFFKRLAHSVIETVAIISQVKMHERNYSAPFIESKIGGIVL